MCQDTRQMLQQCSCAPSEERFLLLEKNWSLHLRLKKGFTLPLFFLLQQAKCSCLWEWPHTHNQEWRCVINAKHWAGEDTEFYFDLYCHLGKFPNCEMHCFHSLVELRMVNLHSWMNVNRSLRNKMQIHIYCFQGTFSSNLQSSFRNKRISLLCKEEPVRMDRKNTMAHLNFSGGSAQCQATC